MRRKPARDFALCVGALLAASVAVATAFTRRADVEQGSAQQQRPSISVAQRASPQQLSRAITLYATDDDGPQAEQLFRSVIANAPVSTPDGATARYYLGRLYHRNYYMLNQRDGLDRAAAYYKDVHNTPIGGERRGAWYAEARFYKSLAYLEQGKWKDVVEAIEHINPSLDADVEIDYLVWSLRKRSMNKRVKTAALREDYLTLLKQLSVTRARPNGADAKTRDAVLAGLQRLLQK